MLAVDPPPAPQTEVTPFSAEEARRFAAGASQHRLEARWLIGMLLGLRQGEVLGLRWADIDPDRGTITVSGSLQRGANGLAHAPTKTRRSMRTVPLGLAVAEALHRWSVRQRDERAQAGSLWEESGYVFTTATGRPISPRNDYRSFQALLVKSGLRRVRLHDLRHTAASLMLASGVSARVVMELLGHSQISVTLDTYTHVDITQTSDAVDRITGLVIEARL